jgi:hypothetical protein
MPFSDPNGRSPTVARRFWKTVTPEKEMETLIQNFRKERFFSLANKLTESDDPAERQQIKEELARMTFGD